MDLILYYGYKIPAVFRKIRDAVIREIETMTSLNVSAVSLTAKSLVLQPDYKNNNKDFMTV